MSIAGHERRWPMPGLLREVIFLSLLVPEDFLVVLERHGREMSGNRRNLTGAGRRYCLFLSETGLQEIAEVIGRAVVGLLEILYAVEVHFLAVFHRLVVELL